MAVTRKPVTYTATPSPSMSSPSPLNKNEKDQEKSPPPPALPTRINASNPSSTTQQQEQPQEQPPLPSRKPGVAHPSLSHTKQWTNSSASSSNLDYTHQRVLTLPASQSSSSLEASLATNSNARATHMRPLYLHTPKKLFPGDTARNTNLAQLESSHIIDEFVATPGLVKGGGLIKDVRKHARHATRSHDDNASVDSGKSTRDSEAANRIKQFYNECELLRKKNELYERILRERNIQVDQVVSAPDTPAAESSSAPQDMPAASAAAKENVKPHDPILLKWKEIEECTISILNQLGIDEEGTPVAAAFTPKSPAKSADGEIQIESEAKQVTAEPLKAEFKQPHTPELPMQKPRPGTKKPDDLKTSPPKTMTIESINLQQEKIPPATNPASSMLKKKPSTSKSTLSAPILLRETVEAISDSLSMPKQTLSIHDQTKLNKKADSLLSAIKQEQTKIKNTSKGSAQNDSLLPVLNAKSPTVQPTPLLQDKLDQDSNHELGIRHSPIPKDLAPVSIEDHLGPTFTTADPKSIMDSIEQDLSNIMSGYGLSDFGF